ncbi:MAG: hypothetical protein ACM3ML_25770 [Micromonosporaceae bacterium]
MDIVTAYVVYLAITIALTVTVARALTRSGRVFLAEVFGGDDILAGAVNRLFVIGFYLLNLGFAALTMRTTANIGTARQMLEMLSIKLGELLLIIGTLHVANVFVFTRIRRAMQDRRPVTRAHSGAAALSVGGHPEPYSGPRD